MNRPPESASIPAAVIASRVGVRVYSGRIPAPSCTVDVFAARYPR